MPDKWHINGLHEGYLIHYQVNTSLCWAPWTVNNASRACVANQKHLISQRATTAYSKRTYTQPPKHTQAEIKSYHRLHGDKSLFCSWLWFLSQLFQSKKRCRKTGRHCHCEIRPENVISLQIKHMPTFRNFGKVQATQFRDRGCMLLLNGWPGR